jgi:hypothetical protein
VLDVQQLSDRAEIGDVINRMASCQDRREWAGLDEVLAENVDVDYGPGYGGPATGVARGDLIASWQESLTRMDASQHVLSGMQIRLDGDAADVELNELARLTRSAVEGSRLYSFGARMELRLARLPEGWRITVLRVRGTWSDGNAAVLGGYKFEKS